MPIRFSTEAANADHMDDEAKAGAADVARARAAARPEPARPRQDADKDDAGQPGKDINAAGFIHDKESGRP